LKIIYKHRLLFLFVIYSLLFVISSCTPSGKTYDEEGKEKTEEEEKKKEEKKETSEESEAMGALIITTAKAEQDNPMYSPSEDSTYLYWLGNRLLILSNHTKCNIYALNTLFKAGFKTPVVNALTRDLVDTSKFTDIFPVVGISEPDSARKGDLIVWNGHVIIFESLTKIKTDLYCYAWWAGTSQADNGDNIRNNVIYGKYKLKGYYVIRRPVKK
jgi:hypothetical protein